MAIAVVGWRRHSKLDDEMNLKTRGECSKTRGEVERQEEVHNLW